MAKLTFNSVAREICKREESNSREVNITDVKRVMRHFLDIISEDATPVVFSLDDDVHPGLAFVVREMAKRRKSKRPDKKGSKS